MAPAISSAVSGVVCAGGKFDGSFIKASGWVCGQRRISWSQVLEFPDKLLQVGRLKAWRFAAGDDSETYAVLAHVAVIKILFKHPADMLRGKAVGLQHVKCVRQAAAGVFQRRGSKLRQLAARKRSPVRTANPAGQQAGDLHFFRKPVINGLVHRVGSEGLAVWARVARMKIPRSGFTWAMTRVRPPSTSRRSKGPRSSPSPSWMDFWERNSRKLIRSFTSAHCHS